MYRKFNIILTDALQLFNEGLRNLPAAFSIKETVQGYVQHHFNTPDNRHYIGVIPEIKHVGAKNMKVEDLHELHKWCLEQSDITDWIFKNELIKHCRADVEVDLGLC